MGVTEYTIGQLAEAAEVPVSTLRYYERRGLLRPLRRTSGNFRVYSEEAVSRVRFIRIAQATGFALDDIEVLAHFIDREGEETVCERVLGLIDDRLADVERRLREIRELRRTLIAAREECLASEAEDRCRVVHWLDEASRRTDSKKSGDRGKP